MSAHLGPLVSALVDDQLTPIARERALSHAAGCDQCTSEIRATRAARGILSSAHGVPELRTDFMSGLVNLAHTQVPQSGSPAETSARANPFIPVAEVPKTEFSGDLKQPKTAGQWLKYTAVFALGSACTAAFILGSPPVINPVSNTSVLAQRLGVVQDAKLFTPEAQVSASQVSDTLDSIDTDALQEWLRSNGWSAPAYLPHGVSVQRVGYVNGRNQELEIVVKTPSGMVLISEAKGKLDTEKISEYETFDAASGSVYVLSSQPAHLVWQSGDTVIELVSQLSTEQLKELCHSFEVEGYDTGISARFIRGFSDLAGAISE